MTSDGAALLAAAITASISVKVLQRIVQTVALVSAFAPCAAERLKIAVQTKRVAGPPRQRSRWLFNNAGVAGCSTMLCIANTKEERRLCFFSRSCPQDQRGFPASKTKVNVIVCIVSGEYAKHRSVVVRFCDGHCLGGGDGILEIATQNVLIAKSFVALFTSRGGRSGRPASDG
eukprot:6313390-Amphidinium_carterae.1